MNTLSRSGLPIAAVERDTGLAKDTLRVWERRYGFPAPERDSHGERVYPAAQVEKLRLIKRLIDQGLRPAKLMGYDVLVLNETLATLNVGSTKERAECNQECDSLLKLIHLHRYEELRRGLQTLLLKMGLQRFVMEVLAPLNGLVGDAWLRGELEVPEEHLYTEQVQNILRGAINARHPDGQGRPQVLLTTFPSEPHALGLLMVEAMLVPEGACCLSLGVQTPLADIIVAATHFDIVALSFSAAYPPRKAIEGLTTLRRALPTGTALWAGGAALAGTARKLDDITVFTTLADIPAALAAWREEHGAA